MTQISPIFDLDLLSFQTNYSGSEVGSRYGYHP
jgi:hypothetical protein